MANAKRFRWTTQRALAAAALLLGALAVLGNPYRGETAHVDTQTLAAIVEGEVDHVTAPELADWIIQGTTEYRLLDLRRASEFADYRIPNAENVRITDLDEYPIARNERIVLYSNGGIHSAQAWFLLKARRYAGVYILLGGLEGWKDEVLFPEAPQEVTPEALAAFQRAVSVSEFFGGAPRAPATSSTEAQAWEPETLELPKVAPPAAVAPKTPRKKKSKEGC